ncbi:ddt domain protein [Gigaspora margarita]|uniref:Ddt domain protein n=1 Tax=Gigaspora margarita TaxID=4874 RepID=A0A8H4A9N1_GIGMA|nr:ddt domain protein [Gigaspora margarita]
MPLYQRKQIPLIPAPKLDASEHGDRNVWVIPYTHEIFIKYEDYLARIALYNRPIWQCALTGKQSLNYKEALDSENTHREALQEKFPEGLKRQILELVQFQTERLDVLVNKIFEKYKDQYALGEIVYVVSEGKKLKAKIADVKFDDTNEEMSSSGVKASSSKSRKAVSSQITYRVQMLDDSGNALRQKSSKKYITKTVNGGETMSRVDKLSFTKTLIRQFIKESATKGTYVRAPWLVEKRLAKKYGVSTKLPEDLQRAKDEAIEKSKKRKLASRDAPAKKSKNNKGTSNNVRDSKKQESASIGKKTASKKQGNQKQSSKKQASKKQTSKSTAEKAKQEKKKQQELEKKRKEAERQAERDKKLKEKEEQKRLKAEAKKIKYPIEDLEVPLDKTLLSKRPLLSQEFKVPQKSVGTLLMIWNFLSIFGKPLGLSFYTLDDFETSLCHNMSNPRCYLVIETHVALLNAIIKDQLFFKGKKRQMTSRNTTARDNIKNESDSDPQTDQVNDESIAGSTQEILNELGKRWDKRIISPGDGRRGWEGVLIGCIQQLGTYESVPNLDNILSHLVPNDQADSDEDFEENYATLEIPDKLQILNFLVNLTTKTTVIHDHIDRCAEKLVELNKEKNDLIKEKRQIICTFAEISKGNLPSTSKTNTLNNVGNITDSPVEDGLDTLNARKRKLEEEEIALQKREEQIEKDKRKYALPRILPLGRDRFYNKYYYTDCIGAAVGEKYGTGRIFVETPSTYDLQIMTEKEEQRFNKRRKVEEASFNSDSDNQTRWGYYEEISQVEELRQWFNTKGIRELTLSNELTARYQDISLSMNKRQQDMAVSYSSQEVRRSRRTQATLATLSAQPYMKWTNKLVK